MKQLVHLFQTLKLRWLILLMVPAKYYWVNDH